MPTWGAQLESMHQTNTIPHTQHKCIRFVDHKSYIVPKDRNDHNGMEISNAAHVLSFQTS